MIKLTILVEEMDGCFVVHWLESNDAITPEGTITDKCTDPWLTLTLTFFFFLECQKSLARQVFYLKDHDDRIRNQLKVIGDANKKG